MCKILWTIKFHSALSVYFFSRIYLRIDEWIFFSVDHFPRFSLPNEDTISLLFSLSLSLSLWFRFKMYKAVTWIRIESRSLWAGFRRVPLIRIHRLTRIYPRRGGMLPERDRDALFNAATREFARKTMGNSRLNRISGWIPIVLVIHLTSSVAILSDTRKSEISCR